jgi:hypothetical protein
MVFSGERLYVEVDPRPLGNLCTKRFKQPLALEVVIGRSRAIFKLTDALRDELARKYRRLPTRSWALDLLMNRCSDLKRDALVKVAERRREAAFRPTRVSPVLARRGTVPGSHVARFPVLRSSEARRTASGSTNP